MNCDVAVTADRHVSGVVSLVVLRRKFGSEKGDRVEDDVISDARI
jgi:hypothetical protein